MLNKKWTNQITKLILCLSTTLLLTGTISYAEIVKIDPDHVAMTTSDYKILLKSAHEGEIRAIDDKKPETGKIFVGAGVGFNNASIFGGYIFP